MAVYSVTSEGEEALAAATAETLVQLRGVATTRAVLLGWSVSFDGISATDAPVVVRLLRQTTDGTGSAASEVAYDPAERAALLTSFHSFSAEGTAGDVLRTENVHPQGGYTEWFPEDARPVIAAATTSRIAIEATAPAIVNAVATLIWKEV